MLRGEGGRCASSTEKVGSEKEINGRIRRNYLKKLAKVLGTRNLKETSAGKGKYDISVRILG